MNQSNVTFAGEEHYGGFLVYNIIMLCLLVIPITTFNLILLIALIHSKRIPKPFQVLLVNILMSPLLLTAMYLYYYPSNIRSILCSCSTTSDVVYTTLLWILASCLTARLLFMSCYTIFTYTTVRYKPAKVWQILLISVAIWSTSFLLNASLYSSKVATIYHINELLKTPRSAGTLSYVYGAIYFIIPIVAFTLGICMPLATICFIRRGSITGDFTLYRGLAKFTFFLLVGNAFGVFGQLIPLLLILFSINDSNNHTVEILMYAKSVSAQVSFVPTPILFFLYFKHLRKQIKKFVFFLCAKTKRLTIERSKTQML